LTQLPDQLGRNANDKTLRSDIFGNHSPGCDSRASSDTYTCEDFDACSKPATFFDVNRARKGSALGFLAALHIDRMGGGADANSRSDEGTVSDMNRRVVMNLNTIRRVSNLGYDHRDQS
jgi:hypothetical protein